MRLLSDLHEKGIKAVLLPGGKIKLSPKDKITDDLREQIERHREELREELIKSMIDELTEELREDNRRNSRGFRIRNKPIKPVKERKRIALYKSG